MLYHVMGLSLVLRILTAASICFDHLTLILFPKNQIVKQRPRDNKNPAKRQSCRGVTRLAYRDGFRTLLANIII